LNLVKRLTGYGVESLGVIILDCSEKYPKRGIFVWLSCVGYEVGAAAISQTRPLNFLGGKY